MNLFITLFNEIVYKPLFNGLVFLYDFIPGNDFGLAIIVLTLIIKFILYPLSQKAIKSQKAMAELQPKIKELQKNIKNKEEQAKAMIDLYKKYKINPASGCLPILIQLPILFALYRVFYNGLNPERMDSLYSFVPMPEVFNSDFLGIIDLSQSNVILAVLAGILMFFQFKLTSSMNKLNFKKGKGDFASMMTKQMTYMMPLMTAFIAMSLPAALALYWVVVTLFGIIQQYLTKKPALEGQAYQKNGQKA